MELILDAISRGSITWSFEAWDCIWGFGEFISQAIILESPLLIPAVIENAWKKRRATSVRFHLPELLGVYSPQIEYHMWPWLSTDIIFLESLLFIRGHGKHVLCNTICSIGKKKLKNKVFITAHQQAGNNMWGKHAHKFVWHLIECCWISPLLETFHLLTDFMLFSIQISPGWKSMVWYQSRTLSLSAGGIKFFNCDR